MSDRSEIPAVPPMAIDEAASSEPNRGLFRGALVYAIACFAIAGVGARLGQNAFDDANAGDSFVPLSGPVEAELDALIWSTIVVASLALIVCFWFVGRANRRREQRLSIAHIHWVYVLAIAGPVVALSVFGISLIVGSW